MRVYTVMVDTRYDNGVADRPRCIPVTLPWVSILAGDGLKPYEHEARPVPRLKLKAVRSGLISRGQLTRLLKLRSYTVTSTLARAGVERVHVGVSRTLYYDRASALAALTKPPGARVVTSSSAPRAPRRVHPDSPASPGLTGGYQALIRMLDNGHTPAEGGAAEIRFSENPISA